MILDIILVLLVLLFIFIGYKVGFVRVLLKLASFIGGLILAISLTGPTTNLAVDAGWTNGLSDNIYNNIVSNEQYQEYYQGDSTATVEQLLEAMGLPGFVAKIVANTALKDVDIETTTRNIANGLSRIIFMVIIFFAIWILTGIVLAIIKALFKNVREHVGFIGVIDGILGAAVFIILLWIILQITLAIFSAVMNGDSGFAGFLNDQIHPTDDRFGLVKYLYNHNFIKNFFSLLF